MLFSSLPFLYLFLPLCVLCYFLMPSIRAKNAVLLVFSLVFYAWGEPVYVLLKPHDFKPMLHGTCTTGPESTDMRSLLTRLL